MNHGANFGRNVSKLALTCHGNNDSAPGWTGVELYNVGCLPGTHLARTRLSGPLLGYPLFFSFSPPLMMSALVSLAPLTLRTGFIPSLFCLAVLYVGKYFPFRKSDGAGMELEQCMCVNATMTGQGCDVVMQETATRGGFQPGRKR